MSFEFIAVIILAVVLAAVLRSYDNLWRELSRIKKEKEDIEERARTHALKILDEAKDKALEIVEDAQLKAEKNKLIVEEKLDEVSSAQIDKYKEVVQNISKVVEGEAVRELDQFKNILEKETLEAQKIIGSKINDQYSKVTEELENYRLRKITELDNKAFEVIKLVVNKIIGKTISTEEHAQLVVKALEEAKHDQVI
jgi:type II secretory pathway component PulJ